MRQFFKLLEAKTNGSVSVHLGAMLSSVPHFSSTLFDGVSQHILKVSL